jgi:hypothetical protein
MPAWRYVANRGLTFAGNLLMGTKLSEFHTGYRAFSRELLERLPLDANSDDFIFDNQILAEVAWLNLPIGEVSCPTSYAPESSSINFSRSVRYGFGCLSPRCSSGWREWTVSIEAVPERRECLGRLKGRLLSESHTLRVSPARQPASTDT